MGTKKKTKVTVETAETTDKIRETVVVHSAECDNCKELQKSISRLEQTIKEKQKIVDTQLENLRVLQIKIDKLQARGFWARVFNENVE